MAEKSKNTALAARFACSLAVGAAAAALCLCGMATLMAGHGLSRALAWPLATGAVCAGSFAGGALHALLQKSRGLACGAALGGVFAVLMLAAQCAAGSAPDAKQWLSLVFILLAGAAGGALPAFAPRRHRH